MTEPGVHSEIESKRVISKEEIKDRLHLYHATTQQKWKLIQKEGAILSERELAKRDLIELDESGLSDSTSTGELDREIRNDEYVFLSHRDIGFDNVVFTVDPSVLEIEGAMINTAGDYLHFVNDPELEDYYHKSQIPASQFLDYLYKFVNSLPNPEWFFGIRDQEFETFMQEAMSERFIDQNPEKFKTFFALNPEVKIPNNLPIRYITDVKDYSGK